MTEEVNDIVVDSIKAHRTSSYKPSPTAESRNAIYVRNLYKSYGTGKNRSTILRSLDMTVKQGTIYGLLGPSGCGKTTLLSCVIGRRSFDSGDLSVLGTQPGTPSSGIPGCRIGFMPQEIALYQDFSIKEMFQYFGSLFDLNSLFVERQTDLFCKLLDLPPVKRIVKTLSGGQQRRVSFAVTLFHEPELLILDEPTSGVDPVLRTSIWDYLTHLSRDKGVTVIITTHYIEETVKADMVSMMRSGRLLVEDSPKNLLLIHELTTLEDVFLKMCIKDVEQSSTETKKEGNRPSYRAIPDDEINFRKINASLDESLEIKKNKKKTFDMAMPSARRTRALIHKNFLQLFRNIGMLLFVITIPAAQVVFFFLSIGRESTSLKIGIFNEELTRSPNGVCNYTMECEGTSMFSCHFLRSLDHTTFVQVNYDKYSDAVESVKKGQIWGVVHFEPQFSEKLLARIEEGGLSDNETLWGSQIHVRLDSSNKFISNTIQRKLFLAFENLHANILETCSYDRNAASRVLMFRNDVFDENKFSMTDSMAPGMILAIVYFFALLLTSTLFIIEKQSGHLDRNLVSGVQATEIIIAHLVSQSIVMVTQMTIVYIFILFVFDVQCEGSLLNAILLTIAQGLCGMSHGVLVSEICSEIMEALGMAVAFLFSNFLLSGMIWPLESVFFVLRYISYWFPQTIAVQSMRNIFTRGWGMEKSEVYVGFLTSFGWMSVFLIITLLHFRLSN